MEEQDIKKRIEELKARDRLKRNQRYANMSQEEKKRRADLRRKKLLQETPEARAARLAKLKNNNDKTKLTKTKWFNDLKDFNKTVEHLKDEGVLIYVDHPPSKPKKNDVATQVNFYEKLNDEVSINEPTNDVITKNSATLSYKLNKNKITSNWTISKTQNSDNELKESASLTEYEDNSSDSTIVYWNNLEKNSEDDEYETIIPNTPPSEKYENEKVDHNNNEALSENDDNLNNDQYCEQIENKFTILTTQSIPQQPIKLNCNSPKTITITDSNLLSHDFKNTVSANEINHNNTFKQAATVTENLFSTNKKQQNSDTFASLCNHPSTSSDYSALQEWKRVIELTSSDEDDLLIESSQASVQLLS